MSIQIKAKAIVVHGEKLYEVEEVSALTKDELPKEYMEGYPRVYYAGSPNCIAIAKSDFCTSVLLFGHKYTVPEMDKRLETIRAAGDRLHEINARLAKENEGWEGTYYWTI